MPGAWLDTNQVVLACPAHRAGAVLRALDGELAALLDSIPYTSSMTVGLIYDRAELRHPLDGFGFLVPRSERRGVVACTWVNTKFDHRAPGDRAVLRCFLGGSGEAGSLSQSDETIIDGVLDELRRLMGISARPLEWRIARWPASMAQYTLGHARRVDEIATRLKQHPGIHLAGNAYYGIGIPDCVRMGKEVAERIAAEITV
jgi:oxygen-dependent protoporphyrinogen oxidase